MKAQRRHELKTNTLATSLQDLPELARRWGSSLLLAVVVVGLAMVLLRIRSNNAADRLLEDSQNLVTARAQINELQFLYRALPPDSEPSEDDVKQLAYDRNKVIDDIGSELKAVQSDTTADDTTLAAELEAEGDLALTLAQLPDLPGAAESSSLNLNRTRDNYLKDAAAAYQKVISKYPDQKLSALNARFGLAAVAECQSDWGAARNQLQAIVDEADTAPAVKQRAQAQLADLDTLKSPVHLMLAAVPRETGFAYLMPSIDPPAWFKPPTTAPSIPATKPANGP